jgi:hypothetical protein
MVRFINGSWFIDSKSYLIQGGEGVTQARRMRGKIRCHVQAWTDLVDEDEESSWEELWYFISAYSLQFSY